MPTNLKWKLILIATLTAVAILLCVPSLMWDYSQNQSRMPDWWKNARILPRRAVVLGLDLQGGMHLVVSVNTEEAVRNDLTQMKDYIKDALRQEKIVVEEIKLTEDDKIQIDYSDSADLEKGSDLVRKYYGRVLREDAPSALRRVYTLDEAQANEYRNNAVKQVMETLNSRIDEFGVAEPSIQKSGVNRIVLQLPGIKEEDRNRVLNIIQRTAKLEFMLVDDVASSKEALLAKSNGNLPPGRIILPEVDEKTGKVTAWYLLKTEPKMTGSYLVDARMTTGGKMDLGGGYNVDFQFNLEGARLFSRITGENIGKNLAIVLEDKVKSAPVIKSRIFDRGMIEGRFTLEEARDLAIVLRAGALPVGIKIEEERTVGPTLGKDLIARGQLAALTAVAAVLLFMVTYYSAGGLIADLAVFLNLLFIFAGLASLRATLTLPGIAGIALTVGMALDANVIIFERMREEIRAGKTMRAAIDAGYQRSLWTILDSNITTLIAAAILFQVGTGPIRGFAVTLTIGLVSSVFTSVVATKTIYDLWYLYTGKSGKLRIGLKSAD